MLRRGVPSPVLVPCGPHRMPKPNPDAALSPCEEDRGCRGAGAVAAQVAHQPREAVGTCAPCGGEGMLGCSSAMEGPGHSCTCPRKPRSPPALRDHTRPGPSHTDRCLLREQISHLPRADPVRAATVCQGLGQAVQIDTGQGLGKVQNTLHPPPPSPRERGAKEGEWR